MTNSLIHKTLAAGLASALLLSVPLAAKASEHSPGDDRHRSRGTVVDVARVAWFSASDVDAAAAAQGFQNVKKSRHDVTAYRLVYRTITRDGSATTASGLVALPDDRRGHLPVVEFLHGTNATKADAGSVSDESTDRIVTMMFAGSGMVGIAPDYLGLGLGPGKHPYIDTKTEVSASADMLLAARNFTSGRRIRLDRDVKVTGFSQGGRATMSVGRALQRGEVRGFGLGALAAVAGPYDLERTELPAAFDGRVPPPLATSYLAYFTTAWDRSVGLYDDPAEAFAPEYADTLEDLFDGTHPYPEIQKGLPDSPAKLFTPTFLSRMKNPSGAYLRALREADSICRDWTPRVRTHLYVGSKDVDVLPANSDRCAESLTRRDGKVTVHPVGEVDHSGTAMLAYPQIVRDFDAQD